MEEAVTDQIIKSAAQKFNQSPTIPHIKQQYISQAVIDEEGGTTNMHTDDNRTPNSNLKDSVSNNNISLSNNKENIDYYSNQDHITNVMVNVDGQSMS